MNEYEEEEIVFRSLWKKKQRLSLSFKKSQSG